ncbi:hypothetical protein [Helicobacter felis]|uniref:Beta-galactosidase n=1 Tax=Helicobacter felis (strain ATCC 49179 / CCUG 28539 / NCTC 12436 / CS1) TaxID=936155 RepID=E7AC59_HELFC|nr:hypothetical protein [Helicobacter felis]CBY82141.1 putative Beta-galactosidase [Helicobacter felis ATCC 49179]
MSILRRACQILAQVFPDAHFILDSNTIQNPGLFVIIEGVERLDIQSVRLPCSLYCAFLGVGNQLWENLDPILDFFHSNPSFLEGRFDFYKMSLQEVKEHLSLAHVQFSLRLFKE